MGDIIVANFIIIILETVSATDFNRVLTKEYRWGVSTHKKILNIIYQWENT